MKLLIFPSSCALLKRRKNDRDNRQRNDQRDKKPDTYSYRLVIEQSPGNSSQKYQRHKYRTSRQHRKTTGGRKISAVPSAQATNSESPRSLRWLILSMTIIELSIIIPTPHDQTGQRNGIDRQTDQLEKQYTDNHRNRYTDPDNHR